MKKIEPIDLLRIFMGLVFLSAGLFRVFNWQAGLTEISNLRLPYPPYFLTLVVLLEIIGGLMIISNIKTKKVAAIFIIFITLALLQALIFCQDQFLTAPTKLFSFTANPVDLFLHFTYLIILVYIYSAVSDNSSAGSL